MHHKRRRPKSRRAGCKPWKAECYSRERRLPFRDKRKLGLKRSWV